MNVVPDALSRVSSVDVCHQCDAQCQPQFHSSALVAATARIHSLPSLNEHDLRVLLDQVGEEENAERVRTLADGFFTRPLSSFHHPIVDDVLTVNTLQITSLDLSPHDKAEFVKGYRKNGFIKRLLSAHKDKVYQKRGLFFLKNSPMDRVAKIVVPDDQKLKTRLLAEFHDGESECHPGVQRTYLKLSQWYFWRDMYRDVLEYVTSCLTCMQWKTSSKKKNGRLMPMPTPSECWEVVGVDYITGLPESNGYNAIQTAVCCLSKRPVYAPMKKTDNAVEAAKVFFDSVVRHHGLPKVIVSDRDPKFTSQFWRELCRMMGVRQSMTVAHRAQADGQAERQHRTLEDALRCMVSYHGSDWSEYLGTIEYAHATLVSSSTGLSPFQIDTARQSYHPMTLDAFQLSEEQLRKSRVEYARQFVEERRKLVQKAQEQLLKAQERQQRYYNSKRTEVEFKLGDFVFLRASKIPVQHLVRDSLRVKLAPRKIGPFEIVQVINKNAMKLKLPPELSRLHPVFNVEDLEHSPAPIERFQSRPVFKSTPVREGAEEMFIIEKLLKKRTFNRQLEYLVKWQLPESEATWLRARDIKKGEQWSSLVEDFKRRLRLSRGGCDDRSRSDTRRIRHSRVSNQDVRDSPFRVNNACVTSYGFHSTLPNRLQGSQNGKDI